MDTSTTITAPAPTLVHEFTLSASIKAPVDFGIGSFGNRMYFEVTGGRAEGERFKADLLPSGGDWLVAGADGFGRLDVRIALQTDDGASIYVEYPGLITLNDATTNALTTGGSTEFEDQYFRATPRFETGDERYSWLQTHVFLSVGRIANGGASYHVYRVD